MKKPKISIICAVAEKNQAIGKDNKLLWQIPNDLARFKKITLNHPVIMGYKTYLSIGKPLVKRLNIVLSQDTNLDIPNITICHSIQEAIDVASKKDDDEIFFIGGGSIYNQAVKLADKLYLTLVEGDYDADTFFPDYSDFQNKVFEKKEESDGYKYRFIELERSQEGE